MTSAAQTQDVVKRWRPFEDDHEATVCATLLEDVHDDIVERFEDLDRDLDAEAAATPRFKRKLIRVEVAAVKRVLLNPELLKSETIDDYSATRDTSKLDGVLRLTRDEWASLGIEPPADDDDGRAFTIDQTPAYECAYDVPGGYRRRLV